MTLLLGGPGSGKVRGTGRHLRQCCHAAAAGALLTVYAGCLSVKHCAADAIYAFALFHLVQSTLLKVLSGRLKDTSKNFSVSQATPPNWRCQRKWLLLHG